MMNRIYDYVDIVSRFASWFGGTLLILSAGYISVDVICRKVFSVSIQGGDELSGYALAIAISWSLAFSLLQKANIRIDALYHYFPGYLKAMADMVSLMALGGFTTILFYFSLGVLKESFLYGSLSNTPLEIPLIIPQTLWILGFFIFYLALILVFVRCLNALLKGDIHKVNQISGIRSLEQEIKDETSDEIKTRVFESEQHVEG